MNLEQQGKITVVAWISDAEASNKKEAVGGMGGWFGYDEEKCDADGRWAKAGHRWKDYLEDWKPEVHPYLEAIRQDVVAKGIRLTGEQHQNHSEGVPLFNDGKVALFSFRGWGDLMAAIWSEAENKDYGYMDFYM